MTVLLDFSQDMFDSHALHPVQSFAWGEFRRENGANIERFIIGGKSYLVTFHRLPLSTFTIGILTQCHMVTSAVIDHLFQLGKLHKAIFIKIEPYRYEAADKLSELALLRKKMLALGLVASKPLYPQHSFIVDLTKTEDGLLSQMKSKTRYNIRLAQKKNVEITISQDEAAFQNYLKLLSETTQRQAFFAHTISYQKLMWRFMKKAGIAYLAQATYQGTPLAAFIVFVFQHRIYYPYGASTRTHKELMAPQLLMWEVMKFGKEHACSELELWGSLGNNPNPKHSWYGFHRFKEGFGGQNISYIGAYDLVMRSTWYALYRFIDSLRWLILNTFKKARRA